MQHTNITAQQGSGQILRRFLLCLTLGWAGLLAVQADTLVVAGLSSDLTPPMLIEDADVLAPIAPALRLLGAPTTISESAIAITPTGAPPVKLTIGSTAAWVGTRKVTLALSPRRVNGDVYLPVRALAPFLNADMRVDPTARTLTLTPHLTVEGAPQGEGAAIRVRSTAPIQYQSGTLTNPPRLFFDFRHAAVGTPPVPLELGPGLVTRLRVAQFSRDPDVVRLVVDLTTDATAATVLSDGGRLATITITPAPPTATPPLSPPSQSPALPETLVPAAPVSLLAATITPRGAKQSELAVRASGPLAVASVFDEKRRQLRLTFPSALNTLPAEQLKVPRDPVIAALESTGSATAPGTTLLVTCKAAAGYLIRREATGIRILLGQFDISNMTVVLDAGHGAHDSGAIGAQGTREKDIALDVVLRARRLLQAAGAKVLLTREDDTFIPLDDRPGLANARKADLFLSVHCNSSAVRNSAQGTQTYYFTPQSTALAAAMHVELIKALGLTNGGIRIARFLVIRKSLMPSVLLELAFINNAREEELLTSPAFRQQAADAILAGVRRYAANRTWQFKQGEEPVAEELAPSLPTPPLPLDPPTPPPPLPSLDTP
jgi:N-acetylmuramoyl-L-alanine amidase